MAILNVTPDSFSDGGQLLDESALLDAARAQLAGGATVLDIGGESTRPGALKVPISVELARVIPAVEQIRAEFPNALISVDTRKAEVARQALAAGANWINDVSGLRYDDRMLGTIAEAGATLVLMHSLATPQTMQDAIHYPNDDVVTAIYDWLARQSERALQAGIDPGKLWLDVGFGFGKTLAHNLCLLQILSRFHTLGLPIMVGVSRKSFLTLRQSNALPPSQREAVTAMAHAVAWRQGVQGFRTHEVAIQRNALAFYEAAVSSDSSVKTLAPPGSASSSSGTESITAG